MGFITDLRFATAISLGFVCILITITFYILAYSTPKNTPTRETYDNFSTFSLYVAIPFGLGFLIFAFVYWTYMTQSVKNVEGRAANARKATGRRVAATRVSNAS